MDRITSLNQALTNEILKFLPLKDVHKWRQNQHLIFDRSLEATLGQGHSIESLIYSVLLFHEGGLTKLAIKTPEDTKSFWFGLEDWLNLLSNRRVEEVILSLSPSNTRLIPHSLFSFSDLKELQLTHFSIKLRSSFRSFPRVTSLKLENVHIIGQSIISKCPILKSLELRFSFVIPSLEICSPSLKSLNFSGLSPCFRFENTASLEDVCVSILQTGESFGRSAYGLNLKLRDNLASLKSLNIDWIFLEFLCTGGIVPVFSQLMSLRIELNFADPWIYLPLNQIRASFARTEDTVMDV